MEPAAVQPTLLLRMTECLARLHHIVHLSAEIRDMATYATMGSRGLSLSAENMHRKGIDKFNLFLASKEMLPWNQLQSDELTLDLFQGRYF